MNGLTHRWEAPRIGLGTPPAISGFEPLVRRFLASRGFASAEDATAYADPRLASLHDPSLLPGADEAAARTLDALRSGQRIVIYGDYDADGITASAILLRTLRAVAPGADVRSYIPHRLEEGYGLNAEAIGQLAEDGADLIISVDCGVTAFASADAARSAGADLIITDHHNLPPASEGLPGAFAIVHPRHPDAVAPYPCPHLCGAGVAFKLAWRIATLAAGADRVDGEMREHLLDMLALAALGTIADIVPLTGENRVIARHGLRRLPHTSITGIGALIRACRLQGGVLDAEHVGFQLAPRLNAAGRLAHAAEALELLLTDDEARADAIARELARQNDQRRRTERRIADEAAKQAEREGMTGADRRAIVLAGERWHPGVVGIVCSRLVQRFHRPAILFNQDGELCKGSGRSIDGFNLHEALDHCADHLETYGGHDMAAGLSVRTDRLARFVDEFLAYASDRIGDEMLTPSLAIDFEAPIDELTPLAVRQLTSLGPFGRENPKPSVLLSNVEVVRDPETFGARGAHASIHVRSPDGEMRLVGWRWGERCRDVRAGDTISAVVRPKINEWNGRVSVEPEIRDVMVRQTATASV